MFMLPYEINMMGKVQESLGKGKTYLQKIACFMRMVDADVK